MSVSPIERASARVEASIFSALAAVVDALPPAVQYGWGKTLRNRLLATTVNGLDGLAAPNSATLNELVEIPATQAQAVLVTGSLGTGGLETVVATLARRLPTQGVATTVLCRTGGATADRLRQTGVHVTEAPDRDAASAYLRSLPPGSIAQLHGAPAYAVEVCGALGIPIVSVVHNVDINLSAEDWRQEACIVKSASAVVAVSATVRDYYLRRLARHAAPPVTVIPNGGDLVPFTREEIATERARLSALLGTDLSGATVFCCLARYDLQKNLPGLVASFLEASKTREELHLVVAGPIDDWLEFRLADAIRKMGSSGQRIHLLGRSSARAVLAASDAFLLNSFFEGWPVAATEAVCAGLPLVISEVGGAAELVGPHYERGQLFDNPASRPELIDRASIRRARRRVRQQTNRATMKLAVHAIADSIHEWRSRRCHLVEEARSWLNSTTMVSAHAELLKRVADNAREIRSGSHS